MNRYIASAVRTPRKLVEVWSMTPSLLANPYGASCEPPPPSAASGSIPSACRNIAMASSGEATGGPERVRPAMAYRPRK